MSLNTVIDPAVSTWKDELAARWKHPLGAAYLFAWVVWNHEFLIVAFSEGAYNIRIEYLRDNWSFGLWSSINHFGVPLLVSVLYILAAPWSSWLQSVSNGAAEGATRRARSWFGIRHYTESEMAAIRNEAQQKMDQLRQAKSHSDQAVQQKEETLRRVRETAVALYRNITGMTYVTVNGEDLHGLFKVLDPASLAAPDFSTALVAHMTKNGFPPETLQVLGALRVRLPHSSLAAIVGLTDDISMGVTVHLGYLMAVGCVDVDWSATDEAMYQLSPRGEKLLQIIAREHPHAPYIR